MAPRCAVEGAERRPWLVDAVRRGGGEVVPVGDADALVWGDPVDADGLGKILAEHPGVRWVQLPFAGIENFTDVVGQDRVWTAGQGVYAEPVAEHALALALAGMRQVGRYSRVASWTGPAGRNLLGAPVAILGGGGIARSLLRLLGPFGCDVTVVRKHPEPLPGAARVATLADLHDVLGGADLVVLALSLTPETERVIDASALEAMRSHAWLVNVARGRHVDTGALTAALDDCTIGGAALDVTDPEPLPDGHPLWKLPNCIITPHVGNTPEMAVPLLFARVAENVRRFGAGESLLGVVDAALGY